MYQNSDEIMYRYARAHDKEIESEVAASRGSGFDAHILRRRIALLVGVSLVGLTVMVAILALGWWVL